MADRLGLSLTGSFRRVLSPFLPNPFNIRYDTLIKRWGKHRELFQLEMSMFSQEQSLQTVRHIKKVLRFMNQQSAFEDESQGEAEGVWGDPPKKLRHRSMIYTIPCIDSPLLLLY